jgi:hypothetical protein
MDCITEGSAEINSVGNLNGYNEDNPIARPDNKENKG